MLRNLAIEGRLVIELPFQLEVSHHRVPIDGPRLQIKGAPQKGAAIQQQALGVAKALLQTWILLLGGLALPFQGLEPPFQLHQTLGKQMEGAGKILGAAADPE